MKQSEHKEIIRQDLESKGFKIEHEQHSVRVGIFHIIIFLSKQARVVIETSGSFGSHYIIIDEYRESYSDTSADKLIKWFNKFVNQCKAFDKGINVDVKEVANKMNENGYEHVKGDVGDDWSGQLLDALEELYGIEGTVRKKHEQKVAKKK